jgi:YihY family inner membrane protein
MEFLAPVHKLDAIQQRHTWSAVLFGTIKKFSDDQASNLGVVVAFYAFFSIFPLLLVFVTVLGYVLASDRSLLHSISTSVLGDFPVIGTTLEGKSLKGSVPALAIGVVLTLYSGLGITSAANNAFDQIWGTPRNDRHNFFHKKLYGLILLVLLGGLFALATAASGVVSDGLGGPSLFVFGLIVSFMLNVGLFLLSFRLLPSEHVAWRQLLPGSVLAAVFWTLLQSLGGAYIGHTVKNSGNTYGTFALVLGVIAWLHLGSQLTLYSAELNTVLAKKLWPRSLFGPVVESPSSRDPTAVKRRAEERASTTRQGSSANGDLTEVTAPSARISGPSDGS